MYLFWSKLFFCLICGAQHGIKCRSICSNYWLPQTLSTARCCCTACKCCWEQTQPLPSSFILSPWEISTNGPTPHTSSQRLLTVGHHKVLILTIALAPCDQKEKLFSKMHHSFPFIRSTVAKVKVLYALVWRTQGSFYMGPTGALPRITQREPHGGKVKVIMATWKCGESHDSSFDYSVTHSHNSEKTCNSELILDSPIFP